MRSPTLYEVPASRSAKVCEVQELPASMLIACPEELHEYVRGLFQQKVPSLQYEAEVGYHQVRGLPGELSE